jgi:Zn-dependent alcohol dehydrogenase
VRRLGHHDPHRLDRRTTWWHLRRRRRRPARPAGHVQPAGAVHFSRSLTSSIYGNSDPVRDIPVLVDHLRAGRLDLAGTITDRITLDGVPDAFDRMRRGEGGRSIVVFPRA